MHVVRYKSEFGALWDDFVENSRNGTFIFKRGFMDYHADRFPDHSLLLYDNHDRLIALFPATVNANTVSSHSGLTYGGWVLGPSKPDILQLLEAWQLMTAYYKEAGCDTLIYKAIPDIYNSYPAEEDRYVLFVNNAVCESVLLSSVVMRERTIGFNTGARRHVKRGEKLGLRVKESLDFDVFWSILENRLASRYNSHPVHSLAEIELLHSRFPEEIKLYVVTDSEDKILAGTVLFLCRDVVKAQYIASSDNGREVNAVDFLFFHILEMFFSSGYKALDLGPSCEQGGHVLNKGLVSQKCGYGGRGIVYTTFRVAL